MAALLLLALGVGPVFAAAPPASPTTESHLLGGKRVRVEITRGAGAGKRPAVVLLHRGRGLAAEGASLRAEARRLADAGFTVLLVHYAERASSGATAPVGQPGREGWLAEKKRYSAQLSTASDAVALAARLPGVHPGRVSVLGHGTGGTVALMLAAAGTPSLRSSVSVGGHPGVMERALREAISRKPRAKFPPMLVLFAENDPVRKATEHGGLNSGSLLKGMQDLKVVVYSGQGIPLDRDCEAHSRAAVVAFLSGGGHPRPGKAATDAAPPSDGLHQIGTCRSLCNTILDAKGWSRSILQETARTPAEARKPALWKESSYQEAIYERRGRFGHDTKPFFPPADPKRAYFRAEGLFPTVKEIPDHILVPAGKGAPARLVRDYQRDDLVLIVEHRYGETLTDRVSRAEMRAARKELLDLLLPVAEEVLAEALGKEYDVTALHKALRGPGRAAIEGTTEAVFQALLDSREPESRLRGAFVALAESLLRGSPEPLDAKEKQLDDLVAAWGVVARAQTHLMKKARKLIRRKDGGPVPEDLNAAFQASVIQASQAVIQRGFGGPEKFGRRVSPLLVRAFGPHLGQPHLSLACDFRLTLPGVVVETNGTPPEKESSGGGMCCAPRSTTPVELVWFELPEATALQWRFSSALAFPDGYRMHARSLQGVEAAQKKLLGKVALRTPAQARAYRELVVGHEPLLAAIQAACDGGGLAPLRRHHAKADAEEKARVTALFELLDLPAPGSR